MNEQDIDLLNNDLDALEDCFNDDIEMYRVNIDNKLEKALLEIQNLKTQLPREQQVTLLELCTDNVLETIISQFGLASLFLTIKDGGSVTTTHNFKQGITATDDDNFKYQKMKENESKKWEQVREEGKYDDGFTQRRKEDFNTHEKIYDYMTGKELPKDGRAHIDHIVSAKEIESNPKAHLFLERDKRAKMATSTKNTAYLDSSINQSKGEKSVEEFKKHTAKGQSECNAVRFDINDEKSKKADRDARDFIKQTINSAEFKKYGQELLQTGAKDAAKIFGSQIIGVMFYHVAEGVIIELRHTFNNKGNENTKEIFIRFKNRLLNILQKLKESFKEILNNSIGLAISSFFSNIITFIINLFFTTLKRVVAIIRAGFTSLVEAIKLLANPPKDMTPEEISYAAIKILTAGIIGSLSLGLTEVIEKLLLAILGLQPIMLFPIPFTDGRTVSDAISVTLSSVAGGILTTVAIYWIDKIAEQGKADKIQIQLINQNGLVTEYKLSQTWISIGNAYENIIHTSKESLVKVQKNTIKIKNSLEVMHSSIDETTVLIDNFLKNSI